MDAQLLDIGRRTNGRVVDAQGINADMMIVNEDFNNDARFETNLSCQ